MAKGVYREELETDPDNNKKAEGIQAVLEERGSNYGPFPVNAAYAQALKNFLRSTPGFKRMQPDQQEALDNIMQKIARTLNGNVNYLDNWVDMVGYAQLVVDRMKADEAQTKKA